MKMLTIVKLSIPAGIAAAMASGEYHVKNMRSTKCCTDQVAVLRIKRNCNYENLPVPRPCRSIGFSVFAFTGAFNTGVVTSG